MDPELCISPSTGEVYFIREQWDVTVPKVGGLAGRRVNTRFTPAQITALSRLAVAAIAAMVATDDAGNPL